MSDFSNVLFERDGTLGRVTLNRPEQRNPLDRVTAQEVLAAGERHLEDDRVRSIVITGAGSAFCAGGDLQQMKEFSTMSSEEAFEWPAAIVDLHQLMLV